MTDGLTQGGDEMISGEVAVESLVGQAASAVEITAPANGETKNVVLSKGQTATLNFDATAATPVLEGNDFVLTFDSNGDGSADSRIVFQNLVAESQGADAPVLVIGGVELSAGLLIGQAQALVEGQTLETAAGAGTGPQGGGGSTYDDDFGDTLNGLNAQGALDGTLAGLVTGLEGQEDVFDDAPTAINDISEVVNEAVGNTVSGNLLDNDDFGDDGQGGIRSISQNGVIYELASDGQSVSNLGEGDSFDPATGVLTLVSDAGATLTVNLTGANMGGYTYEGPANHPGEDFALGGGSFDGDTYTQTNPATGTTITVTGNGTQNGVPVDVLVTAAGDGLGVSNVPQGTGDTNFIDNGTVRESLTFTFSNDGGQLSTDYVSFELLGISSDTQFDPEAVSWVAETTEGTITGTSVVGESSFTISAVGITSITLNPTSSGSGFAVGKVSTAPDTMGEVFGYTIEDSDGHQASATLTVTILDDNPTASITLNSDIQITLDETDNDDDDKDEGGLLASVTVESAELFTNDSVFGGDGASASGSVAFDLSLDGRHPIDSGLLDAVTNEAITLTQEPGGDIIGSSATGGEVFRISVDQESGDLTVSQSRAIEHDDSSDHDEDTSPEILGGIFFGTAIELIATVTDADGDQSTDSINLNGLIQFEDDGPSISDGYAGQIKEKRLDDDNPNNSTLEGSMVVDFGADGGSVTGIEFKGWTDADANSSGDANPAVDPAAEVSELRSGNYPVVFADAAIDATTGLLTYIGTANGVEVIRVEIDPSNGDYDITLSGPVNHPDIAYDSHADNIPNGVDDNDDYDPIDLRFEVTVTDGDGDTDTADLTVRIEDDEVDSSSVRAKESNKDNWVKIDEAQLIDSDDAVDRTVSGKLDFGFGADGGYLDRLYFEETRDTEHDDEAPESTLTSDGHEVQFVESETTDGAGNKVLVLTGTNKDTGEEVVVVTINAITAEYTVELKAPVDNEDTDGSFDPLTLGFRYVTYDNDGDQDISRLEIVIIDDQPVAVDDVYSGADVVEDGANQVATGNVLANDDLSADGVVVTSTTEMVGEYGSITINANGNYTYTLNNDAGNVQRLAQGETGKETFTYEIEDADGDTSTAELEITVYGTNDAPQILSAGLKGEYYGTSGIRNLDVFRALVDGNEPDAIFRATEINYAQGSGNLGRDDHLQQFLGDDAATLSTDPDTTNAAGLHMFGKVFLEAGDYQFKVFSDDGYQIQIDGKPVAEFIGNRGPSANTGSVFEIDTSGYYDVDIVWWDQGGAYVFEPALSLDGGSFVPFTSDNFNFLAEADSTVVEPVNTVVEAGNLDDGTVVDGVASATGTMVATDVDNGAVLTWSSETAGTYGTFGIDPTTGAWTYNLDNGLADSLAEGETATETFTVTVTDEFGATDTQDVTITVQGTNDSPIAVVDAGTTDENSSLTVDVLANDTDVDNGDGPSSFSLDGVSVVSGVPADPATVPAEIKIVDNKLVFNPGTAFDYLLNGETATVVVDYIMSDDSGATSTSTATIVVTGSDDTFIIAPNWNASGHKTADVDVLDGTDVTVRDYVEVQADYTDHDESVTLVVENAKRGEITLGDEDDTLVVTNSTNGAGSTTYPAHFAIDAGNGNDQVFINEGEIRSGAPHTTDALITDGSVTTSLVELGDGDDSFINTTLSIDTVDGGAGNDIISAGGGNDVLTGGADADTFVFSLAGDAASGGDGNDVVTDFNAAEDVLHFTDVIDTGAAGLDLDDLNAMITSVDDYGDGNEVVVNFNNGSSIIFEHMGSTASPIDSIDDLVNNPASQIIID